MNYSSKLHAALKSHFGFDTFKGNQLEIISSLLAGNNIFVLMPTGGGKSLCYQLPALMSKGTAIVVSPLIALMKNQVDMMRIHEGCESVAHFLNSTLTKAAVEKVRSDVRSGMTKLLYVAPESLVKEENIEFLKTVPVSFIAVDEAHCISEWGHDFRPEYRKLRPVVNALGNCPVIALTATATPKVRFDILKNLGITDALVFKSSFNRKNLYYEVRPKTQETDREIIRFIKNRPGKAGIIYCLSRKKVEELSELLNINGIRSLPYHAGLEASSRIANQDAFQQEKVDVIVATIAFGMGIDKPDVRFVIHYDIPKSLEGYYQETGRAGRDGGEGVCLTFYSRKDIQKLEKLIQSKPVREQEIGRQLLLETADYAESSVCRRKILMHYFGEDYNSGNCGACDNCLHPRHKRECTCEAVHLLEAVEQTGQRNRIEYIVNVLIGRATDEIRLHGHQNAGAFGLLSDKDERFAVSLVRQAVIAGLLEKDLDNYGILRLTHRGKEFLRKPMRFFITEDRDFSEIEPWQSETAAPGALDRELYAILTGLRRDLARKEEIPPYLVFLDNTLESMATFYPVSHEELMAVPGVGAGKAAKFGDVFLDVIRKYVRENDIESPNSVPVKLVARHYNPKISIIKQIDRKIDLDEICNSMGVEFCDFLNELEAVVEGGTKIDISYWLDPLIDPDQQQEVFDFLHSCQDDDPAALVREFGNEYDEEDLRLLRIRFIAEYGN